MTKTPRRRLPKGLAFEREDATMRQATSVRGVNFRDRSVTLIDLDQVSFYYQKGRRCVFDGVSLHLESGYIYGVFGKNGAGKSTLFRMLSGTNAVSAGKIRVMGYDPCERSPRFLRDLYLVPEDIAMPAMRLTEFARLSGALYPHYSHEDLTRYMDMFEIDADQRVSTMSLGQRKKAMIACAMAMRTKVLLMDEPTNGLDITSKRVFRSILGEMSHADRIVMISTHQVRELAELINAVLILKGKKFVVSDTVANLSNQYVFGPCDPNDADNPPIYYEQIAGIHVGICRRKAGESVSTATQSEAENLAASSGIDLELLFAAAVSGAFQSL